MKIHLRPLLVPMPPAPPPKPPLTAFQLQMQAEELTKTAQRQRGRLNKLFGAQKNPRDFDEDTNSETPERDHRSNRNLDYLA